MPVYTSSRHALRYPAPAAAAAAPAWTPLSLPSLLLWNQADDIGQADASAVSSWADKSGSSRTLTQATGTLQPIYKTGILNGHAVVRFDATDDRIETTSVLGLTIGTGNFTMACVVKSPASLAATSTIMGMGDIVGATQFYATAPAKINFRINGDHPFGTTVTAATWYTLIVSRSGTSINVWLNGTVDPTTLTNGDALDNTTFFYGSRPSSVQPLGGDIADGLLMNAAISSGDRASLESYWRTRYAHY